MTDRSRWREIDRLFQATTEATSEAERRALLASIESPTLRAEVEALLALDDGAEDFFRGRIQGVELPADAALEGQLAGEFRIVRLIGVGGMGKVYLAERADGEFEQRVAIKFASPTSTWAAWATERFRTERNILARLEHPNIARMLGGGTSAAGVPYLVLEYVEGVPLTAWLRDRKPDLRAKLKLFLGVCDAVSYAHRNLVVHRDIKPGNILVTADGVPKLLDFGISKRMDTPARPQAETAAMTMQLMTPAYASPEQVRGEPVTTATDVYSLGAVLYEILTGQPPFDFERVTPLEVERLIHQGAPRAPGIASDLGRIAAKALHTSADRRYPSVEQLSADIQRFLDGRPVTAQPDSWWYRSRKFVVRNRNAMAALAVLAVLVGAYGLEKFNEAKRLQRAFRNLRAGANATLVELPERAQGRKPAEIRVEIGRLYERSAIALAEELSDMPAALREVAIGYEAIAKALGLDHEKSTGMYQESLAYFEKAIAVLQPVYASGNADAAARQMLGRLYCSAARQRARLGEPEDRVRRDFDEGLRILRQAVNEREPKGRLVRELAEGYAFAGDFELSLGRLEQARKYYGESVRIGAIQVRNIGRKAAAWKVRGLLGMARVEAAAGQRTIAARLLREGQELLRDAFLESRYRDLPGRLLEAWIQWELSRVDPNENPDNARRLSAALTREYPQHPLVADLRATTASTHEAGVRD